MLVLSIMVIILDQVSKYLAVKHLKGNLGKKILGDFFSLTYLENRGAAFGILQDRKIFFIIVSIAVVIGLITIIVKYGNQLDLVSKLSLSLILAGAIGNFIDRIRQGYVVDFLSFRFFGYSFPIFNIADISIVIGTFLLVAVILLEEERS